MVSRQDPKYVVAVTSPVEELIEQPDPTVYEKVPSELELGDVVLVVTVAVSPYLSEFVVYVEGLKVLVALLIVNVPLVVLADGAVYESELVRVTLGTIE